MKFIYHPDRKNISLPGVLYALGDPVRLTIVRNLATEGELSCGVAYPLPIAKSTLSHHMRLLREAGVIFVRQEGRESINSLRGEDIESLFPGLLDTVLRAAESFASEKTSSAFSKPNPVQPQ